MSELEAIVIHVNHCARFCEQTSADGIMPSRAWFTETAALLRDLVGLAEAAEARVKVVEQEVREVRIRASRHLRAVLANPPGSQQEPK